MSAIVEFLPTILASFLKQYPDIHVHLEQHISEHIAVAVRENSADLGIVGEMPDLDQLATVPFRSDELVLLVPNDHTLARHESLSFGEAAAVPFIGLDANSSLHYVLTKAAIEYGKPLDMRIRVASFDAACAMVAAGLGAAVLPRLATLPYVRAFNLASIRLTDSWAVRQLFICRRSGQTLHPAAQLLFEHLTKS